MESLTGNYDRYISKTDAILSQVQDMISDTITVMEQKIELKKKKWIWLQKKLTLLEKNQAYKYKVSENSRKLFEMDFQRIMTAISDFDLMSDADSRKLTGLTKLLMLVEDNNRKRMGFEGLPELDQDQLLIEANKILKFVGKDNKKAL